MTTNASPLVPLLGRLSWMMFGPLALFLFTAFILDSGAGWTTTIDLLFFLVLGGMVLGKWLEFRGGNPRTATGEPASPINFQHYVLLLLLIGPAVWVLANVLGNHVLVK